MVYLLNSRSHFLFYTHSQFFLYDLIFDRCSPTQAGNRKYRTTSATSNAAPTTRCCWRVCWWFAAPWIWRMITLAKENSWQPWIVSTTVYLIHPHPPYPPYPHPPHPHPLAPSFITTSPPHTVKQQISSLVDYAPSFITTSPPPSSPPRPLLHHHLAPTHSETADLLPGWLCPLLHHHLAPTHSETADLLPGWLRPHLHHHLAPSFITTSPTHSETADLLPGWLSPLLHHHLAPTHSETADLLPGWLRPLLHHHLAPTHSETADLLPGWLCPNSRLPGRISFLSVWHTRQNFDAPHHPMAFRNSLDIRRKARSWRWRRNSSSRPYSRHGRGSTRQSVVRVTFLVVKKPRG